jgi:oligo-1,6-glucosidase
LESINAYEKSTDKADMLRYLGLKSRDNARTPMHWNGGPNAGFSTNTPWIMVNPNYREINAEEQIRRADSVFSFYRKLIQFRKQMDIITLGDFELLEPDDPDLFVYTRRYQREELLVVCNFSRKERTFMAPERYIGMQPLLSNEETPVMKTRTVLGAFGATVYFRK